MNTFELDIRNLHLAAYIKYYGANLVRIENNKMIFESSKSLQEWQLEHSKSDSLKIDRELLTLKRLVYNNR